VHSDVYKKYTDHVSTPCDNQGKLQTTMNAYLKAPSERTVSVLRQRSVTSSLVTNLIVKCGLPVSIVDNVNFRAFVADLDPNVSVPCRQTVTQTILPQQLTQMREKLQHIIDDSSDVSLTTDIWTDRRAHAFLAVTVHVFGEGKPNSYLLDFKSFDGSHTGTRIAEALENSVSRYGIQEKIRTIITDNAANMKKAMSVFLDAQESGDAVFDDPSLWEDEQENETVEVLGDNTEHLACFAHTLQLVVRDGLASMSGPHRAVISKCCKLASLTHQSPLFKSSFETVLGAGKSIPVATDTRRNSTFRQMEAVAHLDSALLTNVLQQTHHENIILSAKDLGLLREVIDVLSPFAEATDLSQGDQTVTISCVVPTVLSLSRILESKQSTGSFAKTLLQSLVSRFSGLFETLGMRKSGGEGSRFCSDIYLMAASLDPSFAFHWLQDIPVSQAEKESLRFRVNGK